MIGMTQANAIFTRAIGRVQRLNARDVGLSAILRRRRGTRMHASHPRHPRLGRQPGNHERCVHGRNSQHSGERPKRQEHSERLPLVPPLCRCLLLLPKLHRLDCNHAFVFESELLLRVSLLAGWGPGQLESEVEAGVWYLASCSKKFVLKQCIQLPKPLWNEVMEHMGPPYSDIARRAK